MCRSFSGAHAAVQAVSTGAPDPVVGPTDSTTPSRQYESGASSLRGSRSHFTESAPERRFDHDRDALLTRLSDLRRVCLIGTNDEQVGATNRCRVWNWCLAARASRMFGLWIPAPEKATALPAISFRNSSTSALTRALAALTMASQSDRSTPSHVATFSISSRSTLVIFRSSSAVSMSPRSSSW